jgi:hypothetical protein
LLGKLYKFRDLNYRDGRAASKFQLGTYRNTKAKVCQQSTLEIFVFSLSSYEILTQHHEKDVLTAA